MKAPNLLFWRLFEVESSCLCGCEIGRDRASLSHSLSQSMSYSGWGGEDGMALHPTTEEIIKISKTCPKVFSSYWTLSGTESRFARFPESRAWNRQKFRSEKQDNESNYSKIGEIDSESWSESHPMNAWSDRRSILDSEAPTQCH